MGPEAIKWYTIDELKKFIEINLQPSLCYPNEKLVSSTIPSINRMLILILVERFEIEPELSEKFQKRRNASDL